MTTPPNNVQAKGPKELAEDLFNTAFMQNPRAGHQIAVQVVEYLSLALSHAIDSGRLDPEAYKKVIEFLGSAFLHAIISARFDPVIYMMEALINTIAAVRKDEAERRELLARISEILGNIAKQPAAQQQQQPQSSSAPQPPQQTHAPQQPYAPQQQQPYAPQQQQPYAPQQQQPYAPQQRPSAPQQPSAPSQPWTPPGNSTGKP